MPDSTDARLLAAFEEFVKQDALLDAAIDHDKPTDTLSARVHDLRREIVNARAATIAGAAVQARILLDMIETQGSDWAGEIDLVGARNLVATLDALARAG